MTQSPSAGKNVRIQAGRCSRREACHPEAAAGAASARCSTGRRLKSEGILRKHRRSVAGMLSLRWFTQSTCLPLLSPPPREHQHIIAYAAANPPVARARRARWDLERAITGRDALHVGEKIFTNPSRDGHGCSRRGKRRENDWETSLEGPHLRVKMGPQI
jgi:hypothetical protein